MISNEVDLTAWAKTRQALPKLFSYEPLSKKQDLIYKVRKVFYGTVPLCNL